ncbi:IMPACT family member YvyE [Longimycelium tulufanense]|uniref:IMPACT family member YvyE n=1 Tax=Longimycelium tulufanense TaxID=907463 RepID=A0A8J3CFB7_9PSEU|nr:YigZ family protein [Longimycelium tulufanense]GGM60036.1 IMPACT family member YvyE [Longimycelium tulufanense]
MSQPGPTIHTIRRAGEHEIEIRKSRFVCALARVHDEAEARAFIQARRKLHFDARHNCSAYVLGEDGGTQRSSDDGEPAGTAGVPMLEVLRRRGLTDTVAVVTRYFGGVLLGAGGLIRAYSSATAEAIDRVGVAERRPVRVVSTVVDHASAGRFENDLRGAGYLVRDVHYGDQVRFELAVAEPEIASFESWLAETTSGRASVILGEPTFVEVDV